MSGYGLEWEKEYYNGNTLWNKEHNTKLDKLIDSQPDNMIRRESLQIRELFNANAQEKPFQYSPIDNFEDCQLQGIMYCWVSNHKA
eukprot:5733254-Ditylum_brightwellii.AAC.1